MSNEIVIIKDGKTLGAIIEQIVVETKVNMKKKRLHEDFENAVEGDKKSEENAPSGDEQQSTAQDASNSTDSSAQQNGVNDLQGLKAADAEKMRKGVVKPDDIIDKFNAIRSGKSLKNEDVEPALMKYLNSLSKEEKTAFYAFLKGIAQLVTGEISVPESVADPSNPPANIEMKKVDAPQQRSVKPNVIKRSPVPGVVNKEKKGDEDTSSPVPIMPKKNG